MSLLQALLCDSHIALLKAEGRMVMKQLQQQTALADLLTAAGSGDATAKSRLTSATDEWMLPSKNNTADVVHPMIQWGVHAGDEGGETPLEVSWWGPEDNHALLLYYHRLGVYLHR
ncbi:TPA: hypothetical protein ACH3X1_004174 [Trebouxia sp. C0004]